MPTRPPLNRTKVLRTATRLADRKGLGALSMRKLAQGLGVEAMSLYNHVAGKEDLLDGMVDLVVGEIEVPDVEGNWREAMRGRALSAHRVLVAHPWAIQLIVSRVNVGEAMLRYVDATIGCLRRAGFSVVQADRVWNAIDSHIYGFTLQELGFPFEPSEYAGQAEAYLASVPEETYPHLHEMARHVIEGRHDGLQDFEFGFEILLEGMERLRGAP